MPEQPSTPLRDHEYVAGLDPKRTVDAIFVNAPLRDYTLRPRVNDYTLPVLGLGYIATYAKAQGFNVGVLDAEAHGLGIQHTARIVNALSPRWAGFNLLAPTYRISAEICSLLDPQILIMAGGHHAKAAPDLVLRDERFRRLAALIIGEGETRVAALLDDPGRRSGLPQVMWRDHLLNTTGIGIPQGDRHRWLSPDIDTLPFVDRSFLPQDPYRAEDGRLEANLVCSRGCPYECGFCGAAASMNSDVRIRTRDPRNIIEEMDLLNTQYGTTAFRAVDDLFLGARRVIHHAMDAFTAARIGDRYTWDATGRINVLHREDDHTLATLAANGLREVALGIESGSERILRKMDKRITPQMTHTVTRRLLEHNVNVKGYFILGYPGESRADAADTIAHIRTLWALSDRLPGTFRASVFTFRPYPGSPVWADLVAQGYAPEQMQDYTDVDLTDHGADEAMRGRDEFNFTTGLQFGEVPLPELNRHLADLSREQFHRNHAQGAAA
ncbi:B12-binding domain-containing radical SAM protein (plasmid) [Streptomyces microflavus]|uniref:B12-binding domain-containing radical SAM protein n=1 Tax=Streptomyces microflavus TaxID=1919 RepID=UPI002E15553E|nr:B12-binding domain-containing radical SAM protein [Streptomyces microflavus]